jgi:hypothetical protein
MALQQRPGRPGTLERRERVPTAGHHAQRADGGATAAGGSGD